MKLIVGNGSVEIIHISSLSRTLSMMVSMPCAVSQVKSPEVERMVLHKANYALWYLQQEGFIKQDVSGWFFRIAVVAKGTNDKG